MSFFADHHPALEYPLKYARDRLEQSDSPIAKECMFCIDRLHDIDRVHWPVGWSLVLTESNYLDLPDMLRLLEHLLRRAVASENEWKG